MEKKFNILASLEIWTNIVAALMCCAWFVCKGLGINAILTSALFVLFAMTFVFDRLRTQWAEYSFMELSCDTLVPQEKKQLHQQMTKGIVLIGCAGLDFIYPLIGTSFFWIFPIWAFIQAFRQPRNNYQKS